MRPGDIYYDNDNWVKIAVCNHASISRRERTIVHHCVTEDLDFCLLTETLVKDEDCNSVNRLRKAG